MAHKKIVQGRCYPHFYDVDMSVGQLEKQQKQIDASRKLVCLSTLQTEVCK
jgi:hypothetical protein